MNAPLPRDAVAAMKPLVAAALGASVLTSCSSGGAVSRGMAPGPADTPAPASSTSGVTTPSIDGKLSLNFAVPQTNATSRRQRAFLSPDAVSVRLSVTGEADVVADISRTSPNCSQTTSAPTRTCTITVLAPVGNDTFAATLYDAAGATGNVLGSGSAVQPVAANTPFMVDIGVMGTPSRIVVGAAPSSFTVGTPGTANVVVTAYDADDNVISGTYASPISLTNSDTSGTFVLSTMTLADSSTTVSLTYSGQKAVSMTTLSATCASVKPAAVTPQSITTTPALLLYVAQTNSNAVTITPATAVGNAAPQRTVTGAFTGIGSPLGILTNSTGELYVTSSTYAGDEGPQTMIQAFAPGSNGNVTPDRTIIANYSTSLARDSSDAVYSATPYDGEVEVFDSMAAGYATPLRTVSNASMTAPRGVALDSQDQLYVVDAAREGGGEGAGARVRHVQSQTLDSLFIFPAKANGVTAPVRHIIGADTGLSDPANLVVDGQGYVYVTNEFTSAVTIYGPTADGDAVPIRTISGNATTIVDPIGIALDASGAIYVSDIETNAIEVFAPGANGNVAPARIISGAATGMSSPSQITLRP